MSIGFVGLGNIGGEIARHLAAANGELVVCNRTEHKAKAWVASNGGTVASSPRELAETADIVFVCVGDDSDVREVTLGDNGLLAASRALLIIDHTTTSAAVAQELAQSARAVDSTFVDAPVSGGVAGAKAGSLTAMIGCPESLLGRVEDLLGHHCGRIVRTGPSGSGQLCKMVNQICAAGVIQGLAEGLAFAEATGMEMARVLEVISNGTAQSWQLENRSEWMLNSSFAGGFASRLMKKDLGLCIDAANERGVSMPIASAVHSLYRELQSQGAGDLDFSALITLCRPR